MKVVVEHKVPFMENLDRVADVVRLSAEEITADTVGDADALVVRTRTQCDASLLHGSRVRLVATATIGTDHIDIPWCRAHGVDVANAPGSNAPAVAQYVFSSLMRVINRPLSSYRLGIVGVGNVGRIVERWARAMSMPVMLCDPLRQASEGGEQWNSLDEIAAWADIITFHVPLTRADESPYSTYHLADAEFFRSLRRAPIIINSARGAVVDNAAWAQAIAKGIAGQAIVDCWEGEPHVDGELLRRASIATPHIAGYSIEGKQRASQMALDAISSKFNLPKLKITGSEPPPCPRSITSLEALCSFDPLPETAALKENPSKFEAIRNAYVLRHEPKEGGER